MVPTSAIKILNTLELELALNPLLETIYKSHGAVKYELLLANRRALRILQLAIENVRGLFGVSEGAGLLFGI